MDGTISSLQELPKYSLAPAFSSKIEDVVAAKIDGKMLVPQLRQMMKNNGVSDDEISLVLGDLDPTKSVWQEYRTRSRQIMSSCRM